MRPYFDAPTMPTTEAFIPIYPDISMFPEPMIPRYPVTPMSLKKMSRGNGLKILSKRGLPLPTFNYNIRKNMGLPAAVIIAVMYLGGLILLISFLLMGIVFNMPRKVTVFQLFELSLVMLLGLIVLSIFAVLEPIAAEALTVIELFLMNKLSKLRKRKNTQSISVSYDML